MNQFESVKAAVTLRQAAENYGLTVSRNGMTCCPFHEDRHPSMKLNEDYFFCFGCHASGDVIDFTTRLFGLSPYAAAQKLELKKKAQPYLDALEIASERVRAFLNAILARGQQQEHSQPAHSRQQNIEI